MLNTLNVFTLKQLDKNKKLSYRRFSALSGCRSPQPMSIMFM